MTPATRQPSEKRDAFPAKPLGRLATRVLEGDVVFFVGSGFSIDSEGNTAARLMRRLLIRLCAMASAMGDAGGAVRADLISTFGISGQGTARFPYSDDDVRRLSDRYYETNDWFCGAFGRLLGIWAGRQDAEWGEIASVIAAIEEELRKTSDASGKELDPVPFDEINLALVSWARNGREDMLRSAGKALFLDTMGFRHPGIMGGQPDLRRPDDMLASYSDRLLLRHHVIARLAREGFCTTTITTNYDLLLEGAFRTAGFEHCASEPFTPETYFKEFACITSPCEFFTAGKAHRTAVIMKMHGCARSYRNIPHQSQQALASYLRSMVFTYREIQNWREDSWAADYLRTLLRTQTVVFCGYSLQDPVIHDTFRTVYEEMARERDGDESGADVLPSPADAPAFFFAPGRDRNEFYGMEVLRAASTAVGARREWFSPHPNYIRFHFRNDRAFPHLDEVFRWLLHTVFRLRQEQCLQSELYRVIALLLGRPRPDRELSHVREQFAKLWKWEQGLAQSWNASERSRQEHAALCSWTDGFHNSLLREFACAEELPKDSGQSRRLAWMRQVPWYYPTMSGGAWACWGAVLELALRRMIALALGKEDALKDCWLVRGASCLQPTLLFSMCGQYALKGLTIRVAGMDRQGYQSRIHGQTVQRVFWELAPGDAPWPLVSRSKAPDAEPDHALSRDWLPLGRYSRRAPDAGVIWRWASNTMTAEDEAQLPALLALHAHE
jgi:SIR2-like domain